MPYVDWNVGERAPVVSPQGVREYATLTHVGRAGVEVRLFDRTLCLPLFERADYLSPDEAAASPANAQTTATFSSTT